MRPHIWALAALAAWTLLGFFTIPGHTYLQSDTQIYLPLLERLRDPSLFSNELLIEGQHVSFTIYDEVSLALRRFTGASFETVLHGQQLLFRFLGLVGAYMIALAFRLDRASSLFIAACFGLGAWISGPSILTFEYEPVPRGNAVGLTLLAIGFATHYRHFRAGAASALGFLYQVPAVYPFWGAYLALGVVSGQRRLVRGLVAMAIGVVLLMGAAYMQTGGRESQDFFGRIDAEQEAAMRERASYNWVSMWQPAIHVHHAIVLAVAAAALWRLRRRVAGDLQFLLGALLVIAVLSVPLSLLLLEGLKWNLIPQIQPARALLYGTALAAILCGCAGVFAARSGSWIEAAAWFLAVFALPSRTAPVQHLVFSTAPLLVVVGMALLSALVFRYTTSFVPVLAVAAMPYFAIPKLGGISNYPQLNTPEIQQVADWARQSTPKNAVFFFPDAGRGLQPGIFRARSLRPVYVDWKGGGQINYLRKFLDLWLPRWKQVNEPGFRATKSSGIDYTVWSAEPKPAPGLEVFRNSRYLVYRTPD